MRDPLSLKQTRYTGLVVTVEKASEAPIETDPDPLIYSGDTQGDENEVKLPVDTKKVKNEQFRAAETLTDTLPEIKIDPTDDEEKAVGEVRPKKPEENVNELLTNSTPPLAEGFK